MREIQIELDPPPPEGMFSELELSEMSRIRAPFVKSEACVGCGICQYRCHTRYVIQEQVLGHSAIRVFVVAPAPESAIRRQPQKAQEAQEQAVH